MQQTNVIGLVHLHGNRKKLEGGWVGNIFCIEANKHGNAKHNKPTKPISNHDFIASCSQFSAGKNLKSGVVGENATRVDNVKVVMNSLLILLFKNGLNE